MSPPDNEDDDDDGDDDYDDVDDDGDFVPHFLSSYPQFAGQTGTRDGDVR